MEPTSEGLEREEATRERAWRVAERYKAREKTRSHIGWLAVYVGLLGVWSTVIGVLGVLGALGILDTDFRTRDRALTPALASLAALALGIALLCFARGLWNVKTWARWTALLLFAVGAVASVISLISDGRVNAGLLLWPPFVYLILPSTARRFARAQSRGQAPTEA